MGAEGTAVTFPIRVTHANGTFTASAHGSTAVSTFAATREAAVEAGRRRVKALGASGELVFAEIATAPAPPPALWG